MCLKSCFTKKGFIRQGLFLAFLSSVFFIALNANELKICKSEEDKRFGCMEKLHYANGNLMFATPYKNNKKDGIQREYHDNGKLWGETPYRNGVIDGIVKTYNTDGILMFETPYKNDKKEGILKSYEKGNLLGEYPFKNDKEEGIAKVYYENGNLRVETPIKNNKKEGVQKWYYENGNLALEKTYMNDKVHGSVKFYSKKLIWQVNAENGKLVSGKCVNGKPFTNAHLARINKDINEGYVFSDYWRETCKN